MRLQTYRARAHFPRPPAAVEAQWQRKHHRFHLPDAGSLTDRPIRVIMG
jgi:hypothetical protein